MKIHPIGGYNEVGKNMTVLEIEVNGEKRTLYMDGRLYKNIQQKVIPKVRKRDEDWVWIVDGPERSGKSVFSFQLASLYNLSPLHFYPLLGATVHLYIDRRRRLNR